MKNKERVYENAYKKALVEFGQDKNDREAEDDLQDELFFWWESLLNEQRYTAT